MRGCALGTHKNSLNWLILAVYKLLTPWLCRKVFEMHDTATERAGSQDGIEPAVIDAESPK